MTSKDKQERTTGYNWRNTLSDFAAVSGILAGFSVTFIALILSTVIANVKILNCDVTFGQIAVLFFGLTTGLFIASTELFLQAKDFDVYDVSEPYYNKLKDEDFKGDQNAWNTFVDKQIGFCRDNERAGRKCYNAALFIIFIGLFFAIAPYNLIIALIVSGFGLAIETWQFFK